MARHERTRARQQDWVENRFLTPQPMALTRWVEEPSKASEAELVGGDGMGMNAAQKAANAVVNEVSNKAQRGRHVPQSRTLYRRQVARRR
jgi:putative ribosome biogenesis GTPase RsgA